jgi:hypothetical protein
MSFAALAALLFAMPALTRAAEASTTVICKDGSTSKGGSGACSGHGGVDKKATQASAKSAGSATAPSAPAPSAAEETVTCKDGTTSKGGKGACSGHGGVEKKASKAAAPATPPAASGTQAAPAPAPAAKTPSSTTAKTGTAKNTDPTGAIAKCKDGTYSHAKGHSGACSSHGGVAEWLDQPATK